MKAKKLNIPYQNFDIWLDPRDVTDQATTRLQQTTTTRADYTFQKVTMATWRKKKKKKNDLAPKKPKPFPCFSYSNEEESSSQVVIHSQVIHETTTLCRFAKSV